MKTRFSLFALTSLLLILLIPNQFAIASNQPLPTDQAFRFSASIKDAETIIVQWKLAPNYYLYKDSLSFKLIKPNDAFLGTPIIPNGFTYHDPQFGNKEVFKDSLRIALPIMTDNDKNVTVSVDYRGCSNSGYCYPPTAKQFTTSMTSPVGTTVFGQTTQTMQPATSEQDANTTLKQHHWYWVMLSFIGFGLLLAFTPCVLPMIPILTGIILGKKHIHTWHAFRLSLVYVLSMATTLAVIGIVLALAGSNLQASLQTPWVIYTFAGVLILLALPLFDVKLPTIHIGFQNWINSILQQQRGGHYVGVAMMGVLSMLVISPCVTPPLIGALTYITSTGDVTVGGLALFSLGLGMGLPIMIFAVGGSSIIPSSGAWMQLTKPLAGLLLLGVAASLVQRLFVGPAILLIWAALAMVATFYFGIRLKLTSSVGKWVAKLFAVIFALYTAVLLLGYTHGNSDPLNPLKHHQHQLAFTKVSSLSALEDKIANNYNKPSLVVFTADWCSSCIYIKKNTFTNASVIELLKKFNRLEIDISANSAGDQAIMKHFDVIAPPTLLLFDNQSTMPPKFIVGKVSHTTLTNQLKELITLAE